MNYRETNPQTSGLRPRHRRRGRVVTRTAALLTGLTLLLSACGTLKADEQLSTAATCTTTNLAQGKPATASSTENAGFLGAGAAVDGNLNTRWGSERSDPQWLQVDLGSAQTVCGATLVWEAAYGKAFKIQVSNTRGDAAVWTTIYETTIGTGGTQTITPTVTASGQYVRMLGTQRGTGYGYSLFEFRVFAAEGGTTTPPPTTPPPTTLPTSDTPDFGPNVKIYDDSTPDATIQADLNAAFDRMNLSPTAQFGEDQRYTFLFKPGSYNVYANLGFYTTLAGLGKNPDDVTIANNINVDSGWNLGDEKNATQNFWRSVENLSVQPQGVAKTTRWAVSQAAPMRRVHIKGNLTMGPSNQDFDRGFSSGGYIADSRVDGQVSSGSQQQWYTRNSTIGSWTNSVWNMTFSGVQGAPAQAFPKPPYTTLATTPVTREKPYLYIDGAGKYSVFVPALQRNSSGATWPNTPGTSVPLSRFYVAKPSDNTATLNAALAQGLNLFFPPGVYRLSETLRVTRPDTIVFGLGYPTLVPQGGVNGMTVADVDGVKISGILFDAGEVNTPVLLTVGEAGSSRNHAANPTFIQDVFFRIGGSFRGKATTSLLVNSSDTVIDHIWAWRADHGSVPTGWTINTADHGLIVNGDRVLATGLFVEHYQKYEVIWNGEDGKTIFFQNEMPYDPPTQDVWQSPTGLGYASYKVADNVKTHELWGGGVYCVFNVNRSIVASRGFEVPVTPGVRLHSILTVSLGDVGTILNVVNDTGGAVPNPAGNTVPRNVVSFP